LGVQFIEQAEDLFELCLWDANAVAACFFLQSLTELIIPCVIMNRTDILFSHKENLMSKKVMVFVGTSKGGFIFSSDAKRKKWQMSDIQFKSWNMMHMQIDPRENQGLSNLMDKPIRWIVDDALKFVQREARRGVKYDGIVLDPPKFGRGPKGEVWEVYKPLPTLLEACRECLSNHPLFVVTTIYAVRASAIHVAQAVYANARWEI
jgi:hypothetical protein